MLKFPTNDSNNAILEVCINLPLSHDKSSTNLCDKEELCDNAMIIPMPQLVNEIGSFLLEQNTCAENKQLFSITEG